MILGSFVRHRLSRQQICGGLRELTNLSPMLTSAAPGAVPWATRQLLKNPDMIHTPCARVVSHERPPHGAANLQRLVAQVSPAHYWLPGLSIWVRLRGLKLVRAGQSNAPDAA